MNHSEITNIFFAADHAGFELKNVLFAYVRDELGFDVTDCGAYELDTHDDYPEIIARAAREVSGDSTRKKAIILGGSGQGEAMVANRFSNVRAAVYYGSVPRIIELSREHNDANVLSFGARFVSENEAKQALKAWLTTDFSNEDRHKKRINDIETIPKTGSNM
jgi:ribose 5-phosphate isomerase B